MTPLICVGHRVLSATGRGGEVAAVDLETQIVSVLWDSDDEFLYCYKRARFEVVDASTHVWRLTL